MNGGGGSSGELRAAEEQRQKEIELAQKKINTAFSGFDEEFFTQRERDFESFALPRLSQEFEDTRKGLAFTLARRGLLRSSAESDLGARLERQKNLRLGEVGSQSIAEANKLRQQIESNRSTLFSQAQAGLAPNQAGQQALRAASQFSAPSTFAPVGGFFSDFANRYVDSRVSREFQRGADEATSFDFNRSKKDSISFVN